MISNAFKICLFSFIFCCVALAQTLTVRDIMREPSLAGMRPDSERLSPDGKTVVFSWNAEGKEPRNFYIVSTGGGEPKILVDAEKNYELRTPAPESKLNYGVIVRDDFTKAREKNLGGAEFSPNSKRLLFTQNSDIYVLDLELQSNNQQIENLERSWTRFEANSQRLADLIPNLIKSAQASGVQWTDTYGQIADARSNLLNAMMQPPQGANEKKTEQQKQTVLQSTKNLLASVELLRQLTEKNPKMSSNETFLKMLDEAAGVENRISVEKVDYNYALQKFSPNPRRITRTQGAEFAARWLDDSTILYQSVGNFYALNIDKTSLVQLSKEANPQTFVSVSSAAPTEDAALLAYIASDSSKQRALFVPNYLDEFVQAPTFRRGFTEQKVVVVKTDGSLEKPFEIKIPKAEGASYLRSLDWAADNRSLIVDRVDKDTKRRQLFYIYNVGGKDEQIILLTEETDEKWIGSLSRIVEPNPRDNSQILFASEKDGFNHLYLATLERAKIEPNPTGAIRQENPSNAGFSGKVEIKQLIKGNFEVDWAKWNFKGNDVVYLSTEKGTSERTFSSVQIKNDDADEFPFSSQMLRSLENDTGSSMKTTPQMERGVLLYEVSKWNIPSELFVTTDLNGSGPGTHYTYKLTKTTPDTFLQRKWSEPKFIDIPARDGKVIKSKIYTPADFDKSKKYPMVIFVHGAGYLQNTINGWNNYYREFMFNQLLTQKGYVVLDIDYRGSAGYGRDWRTDVYDFLGGKDYEDHLDAIDFAVKNYAVDEKRVGVYGGSYGGFMAGMLVMRAPEKIAAAAALRPVFDWKNYFASSPVYTTERLGFPERNPEAYKRSSPISYADKLQKPLLILHGMVDDNVPAQDSVQLIEKLMRLEKTEYFEAMFYPAENHGFQRPTSWTDEYERILTFFEKHLK